MQQPSWLLLFMLPKVDYDSHNLSFFDVCLWAVKSSVRDCMAACDF